VTTLETHLAAGRGSDGTAVGELVQAMAAAGVIGSAEDVRLAEEFYAARRA
jgi:hypothetical protein